MEGAHRIWLKHLGTKPSRGEGKQDYYYAKYVFLDRLKDKHPDIFSGEEGATLTRDEMESLLESVTKKTGFLHAGLRAFLARALKEGQEKLDWQVGLPPILVPLPRENARFTPESFLALHKIRRIEQALLSTPGEPASEPLKQRVGRLLLSAVMFGGLVNREWLNPWIFALFERVRVDGTMLWLDMELVWQYERDAADGTGIKIKRIQERRIVRQRRWFADPVTRVLIMHSRDLLREQKDAGTHLPNHWDLIQASLRTLHLAPTDMPGNLQEFLAAARMRLGIHVPGFLASYAEGRLTSVSVPPTTWTRLCLSKAVAVVRDSEPEDTFVPGKAKNCNWGGGTDQTSTDQQKILLSIRRTVTRKGKSAVQCVRDINEILDLKRDRLYPILGLLASWALFLLSRERGNAPSTVERYLGAVADKLLIVCDAEDILEWSTGEFVESYQRVIELVRKESEKRFARDTLGRFHRFLENQFHVPPVGDGFFRGRSAPTEIRVDANLVSQREFDLIKKVLGFDEAVAYLQCGKEEHAEEESTTREDAPDISRRAMACLLIAILGFRCGLRRNEVRFLRLVDLHEEGDVELIVRPTKVRRLKSSSATRRLPLHILLQLDELDLLLSWKAYRLKEDVKIEQQTLLFPVVGLPTTPLPEAKVFPVIRQALTLVTGDETLRYHHLRHSFATWMLVRVSGKSVGFRKEAPFLDHDEFDDRRVTEFRERLLGNDSHGRKGAYLVAALCGHAEVATTFENYLHLNDWLVSRELSRSDALPVVTPEAAAAFTGMSRSSAFRYTSSDAGGRKKFDWNRAFSVFGARAGAFRDPLAAKAVELPVPRIVIDDDPLQEVPVWMTVSKVLHMAQSLKMPVEDICGKLDLSLESVTRWLANVYNIINKKTRPIKARPSKVNSHIRSFLVSDKHSNWSVRSGRYSRHMHLPAARYGSQAKKRNNRKKRLEVFPSPLVYEADRRIVKDMMARFDALNEEDRRAVFHQVDYFIEKYSAQTGMLCFHEMPKARRHLDAVRLLGISNSMIRLIDCGGNDQSPAATRKRRRMWQAELGLQAGNWLTNSKKWGRLAPSGTIGIKIVVKTKGKIQVSYGFRYAVYMLAIAYWK